MDQAEQRHRLSPAGDEDERWKQSTVDQIRQAWLMTWTNLSAFDS
jgi:hypothetical protein